MPQPASTAVKPGQRARLAFDTDTFGVERWIDIEVLGEGERPLETCGDLLAQLATPPGGASKARVVIACASAPLPPVPRRARGFIFAEATAWSVMPESWQWEWADDATRAALNERRATPSLTLSVAYARYSSAAACAPVEAAAVAELERRVTLLCRVPTATTEFVDPCGDVASRLDVVMHRRPRRPLPSWWITPHCEPG